MSYDIPADHHSSVSVPRTARDGHEFPAMMKQRERTLPSHVSSHPMFHATCYLAGPIAGCGYDECTDWRDHAIHRLANHGIAGLSPMRAKEYFRHIERDVGFSATADEYSDFPLSTPRAIMTRDRFDATRCDVLLVNLLGARKVSVGTVMEIAWADLRRTPVVACIEPDGSNVHEHAMIGEAIGFRAGSLDEGLDLVAAILAQPRIT